MSIDNKKKYSDKFERQVEIIHRLIEQPGSIITWNDKIPDPDNLKQLRQIDVTIKRGNTLTLVECRIHKEKQNVKWIEELIGRRTSLKANSVIAVSASGFTKGAIVKARKYGIILRDILSLTKEEIKEWGHKAKLIVTFHEFTNTIITFEFDNKHTKKITTQDALTFIKSYPEKIHGVFVALAKEMENRNPQGFLCKFKIGICPEDINISGVKVLEILTDANHRKVRHQIETSSVVVYDAPEVNALERNVFIEVVENGEFEIAHSIEKSLAAIDATSIKVPANCLFCEALLDFSKPIVSDSIAFMGPPDTSITFYPFIHVRVAFRNIIT